MKDRTYQYFHSSLNSSIIDKDIALLHSCPNWISHQGSWTLPLRHERISSFETPLSKAGWQLKQVYRKLPENMPINGDGKSYLNS